ncbi:MAG: hypothetical protein KJ749_15485, partial [Planctomycetes bacterium]|nr:hypothetical protein [Planctomycetota bacterium]
MMRRPERYCISVMLLAATSVLLLSAPAALAADGRVTGERLDPSAIGPSVVETWAEVLAREQVAPPAWMGNPKARNGQQGIWVVPSQGAMTAPHSGSKHIINKWGDTRIGIGFPELVDVHGAYFAGQSGRGVWTTGIVAIGYRRGIEVDRTARFTAIAKDPAWFAMDLCGVDRIVIESEAVVQGGGWYAMDDLTYTHANDRGQGPIVIDFEDLPYRTKLTGSRYAGLIWEEGTGDFVSGDRQGIHATLAPPGYEEERADDGPGSPLSDVRDSGTLPDLEMEFEASDMAFAGSSYPPDTDGAIGPDHYVETVNRALVVYDRTDGSFVSRTYLSGFMSGAQGDPRVVFDQHSGRWIVIVSGFDTNNKIFLAVSATSDPTGSWFKTSFDTNAGSDWADYPTLGVDVNGIYTAIYQIGSYTHTIFAIDKAPLISHPQSLGTITAFRGLPYDGAIQPAHTYGDPGGEYLVSRYGGSLLRIRRVDPPLTSPTLVDVGFVTVPTGNTPPDAPALGSSTDLDTVGSRLMMSVYRDGSLWTCNTVSVGGRAGVHWYEIDPATTDLIQSGEVADGT